MPARDENRALKEAQSVIEKDRRKLKKEQDDWRLAKSTAQREVVRLKSEKQVLARQTKAAKDELDLLVGDIETEKERKQSLQTKNTALLAENGRIEKELEEATHNLADVEEALASKKASLDKELAEYALTRKQEVKDDILKTNEELVVARTELQQRTSELESRKTELGELNQIYRDEQEELKQSSIETKRLLKEQEDRRATVTEDIEKLDRQIKEMVYKKDQLMLTVTKAREDHDKFVEYEKKARKLLDTKDRQLQEKAAEINQDSQFLRNSRSFLSEL